VLHQEFQIVQVLLGQGRDREFGVGQIDSLLRPQLGRGHAGVGNLQDDFLSVVGEHPTADLAIVEVDDLARSCCREGGVQRAVNACRFDHPAVCVAHGSPPGNVIARQDEDVADREFDRRNDLRQGAEASFGEEFPSAHQAGRGSLFDIGGLA
jgi:hypothetical protein